MPLRLPIVGLELHSHAVPVQCMVNPLLPHAHPAVAFAKVMELTGPLSVLLLPPNLKSVNALHPLPFMLSTTPVLPLPPAAIAKLLLRIAIEYSGCTVLLVIVFHLAPSQWTIVPLSPTAQASIEPCTIPTPRNVLVDAPVNPYHVFPSQPNALPFAPTIHPDMPSLLTVTP